MNNEIRLTPPHNIGEECFVIHNGKARKTIIDDMNYSLKHNKWMITVDKRLTEPDYPVLSGMLITILNEKETVNLEEGSTVFFNEEDATKAAEHNEAVEKVVKYIYDHQRELHNLFVGEDESANVCIFGGIDNFRKNTECYSIAQSMTTEELKKFLSLARAKIRALKCSI